MTRPHRKKLIEVAIPLEAINAAAVREKSIRHGHPSTLHLWWARRPLAACRAVLFAQLVDDPSSRAEELLADAKLRARAAAELPGRVKAWEKAWEKAWGRARLRRGTRRRSRRWRMWRSRSSASGCSPSSRTW